MNLTTSEMQARVRREVAMPSRLRHAALLTASIIVGTAVASLLVTEPALPERTRWAFAGIVVMADNCSDRTVELARRAGAEVHSTVDNTARKAGAINQGFDLVVSTLEDDDVIMTMDADGVLARDCVEEALRVFEERDGVGGVCAAALTRPQTNFLEAAQAVEYAKNILRYYDSYALSWGNPNAGFEKVRIPAS